MFQQNLLWWVGEVSLSRVFGFANDLNNPRIGINLRSFPGTLQIYAVTKWKLLRNFRRKFKSFLFFIFVWTVNDDEIRDEKSHSDKNWTFHNELWNCRSKYIQIVLGNFSPQAHCAPTNITQSSWHQLISDNVRKILSNASSGHDNIYLNRKLC